MPAIYRSVSRTLSVFCQGISSLRLSKSRSSLRMFIKVTTINEIHALTMNRSGVLKRAY